MAIDRDKYMDKAEGKQLRQHAKDRAFLDLKAGRVGGVRAWMLVDLALSTGLRVSELAALKIEDVDLKRSYLLVVRLKRKKKRSETLAIEMDLAPHLKEYIAWTGRKSGSLFEGSRGPLTAQGLQRIWKRSIKLAGLPKELSIHSARHTYAVRLYSQTNDLVLVQRQLGHVSPMTTANMYIHMPFEDIQKAVNGLWR